MVPCVVHYILLHLLMILLGKLAYAMKSKDQVNKKFQQSHAEVGRERGTKVEIHLCMDSRGECPLKSAWHQTSEKSLLISSTKYCE